MKQETLYWTIGGVALALLALFAMRANSGGGSSAPASTGGGGISGSALVSEVNAANANATSVQNNLLASETAYVTHSTDARAGAFTSLVSAAQHELDTVEGAQTQRYAAGVNASAQEYMDNQNALTAQFEAAQKTFQTQYETQAQMQEASIAENVAHFQSDNAVTMARINHGSSFGNFMQSLVGAASNFFGSSTGAKVLGVGG